MLILKQATTLLVSVLVYVVLVNSWLVQNISNLFSNAFALFVLTTEAGKLFHMFTILTEKGYSVKS